MNPRKNEKGRTTVILVIMIKKKRKKQKSLEILSRNVPCLCWKVFFGINTTYRSEEPKRSVKDAIGMVCLRNGKKVRPNFG